MKVFVLLFNAGEANEGIYTLKHEGRNTVLMFEEEDDASQYATLLEKQAAFPRATVESFEREDIEIFCQNAGYEARFIPSYYDPQSGYERQILVPPSSNVETFDWDV